MRVELSYPQSGKLLACSAAPREHPHGSTYPLAVTDRAADPCSLSDRPALRSPPAPVLAAASPSPCRRPGPLRRVSSSCHRLSLVTCRGVTASGRSLAVQAGSSGGQLRLHHKCGSLHAAPRGQQPHLAHHPARSTAAAKVTASPPSLTHSVASPSHPRQPRLGMHGIGHNPAGRPWQRSWPRCKPRGPSARTQTGSRRCSLLLTMMRALLRQSQCCMRCASSTHASSLSHAS